MADERNVDEIIAALNEEEGGEAQAAPVDREVELQSFVTRAAEEAFNWREEDLDGDQARATDYYYGRPFGNEEPGRSRVVSPDVRDTVQAILPSLMRIFFGPERVVEFRPRGPEDVGGAEQQSDYINMVVREDNDGFLVFHAAFKDALVRKLGVIKWWWEDMERVEGGEWTGLTDGQVAMLAQEPGVEYEVTGQYPQPDGSSLYDCIVTRVTQDGRARIAAVPPEEFLFSPEARSIAEADLVGHVREMPASELIAMGIDEELVEENKGRVRAKGASDLTSARRFDEDERDWDERDDSREPVLFGELYVYFDHDGDGVAELRKVWTLGDAYKVVYHEIASDRPFALFTPDPEPHQIIGMSIADYVMDIQLVKSAIIRGQLDSLTLSLNPRTEAVEGEVNMADLLNPEIGGIIRTKKPGMLREVGHSFVGKEAFPMLQYMDEQKENRTGISKAAAGLDADALQSATKAAVAATLSGAQQHIEMLARIFAETGMRQLFRGLLKLTARHQDFARIVRLRNEYIEVDPRSWDADMDVKVNVALGQGDTDERMQKLMVVAQEQKEQLQVGSPLVSLVEYRKTLARIVELAGFPSAEEFFKPWGAQEQQAMDQQKAQQPPPPDPQTQLLQLQAQIEQAKLQLETMKAKADDDRKRDEMVLDYVAKIATAQLQYGGRIQESEMRYLAQAARDAAEVDLENRRSMPNEMTPEMYPEEKIPTNGPGLPE